MTGNKFECFICGKLLVLISFFIMTNLPTIAETGFLQANNFADVSGIAWVRENFFLVVHDAKNPETLPRVSLVKVPGGPEGILWKPLNVQFPEYNSNDLEGIARIPGTDRFLLVESTEELAKKPYSGRIFLSELDGETLKILEVMRWPIKTENIEGAAIARVGENLFFIFAERAHGKKATGIRMGDLRFSPLRLENIRECATFTCPYPTGKNARPVSAIAIDESGTIFVASAEDPDDDNGPFSSAVYKVGKVVKETPSNNPQGMAFHGNNSGAKVVPNRRPALIARLDGMKVEGLAVREQQGKSPELFVGLDDENYGGTIRPIKINRK